MTASDRYLLLGLAPPRADWFATVARWASSASIAADFIKCVSGEELRARLASGRRHSAVLIDARSRAFDRDLIAAAVSAGTPVIAITDQRQQSWSEAELGLSGILREPFDQHDLLDMLINNASVVAKPDELPHLLVDLEAAPWRGRLLAVCGPGGTGASTAAMALAQGFAADPRTAGQVLLADFALRAEQGVLHDARETGPGVQEAVEAHRLGRPNPSEISDLTFDLSDRGYRLLLGLRKPSTWATLRPRAVDATLENLRRSFQCVIADVDSDLEGEAEGGSVDVEERHYLARATISQADVVVIVGAPGVKGVYSLTRVVREVTEIGVDARRILTVCNQSLKGPRAHSEISSTLSMLLTDIPSLASPLFIGHQKVEEALRDGTLLPTSLSTTLSKAVEAIVERVADLPPPGLQAPVAIKPGSLGTWDLGESAAGA